jgi:predicted DNA-binding transcriptional regulator
MASVKIHTGLHGGEPAALVPKDSWPTLATARSIACNRGLRENCRALVFFVEDASKNEWLGFGSFDAYVREGLTLEPEIVQWALDGLKKLDGDDAVTLDVAVKVGREERIKESKRLVHEEGKGVREAARELGVSHPTVIEDLRAVEKTVMTEKSTTERKPVLQINSATNPSTAAQKIKDKFGEDFARALKEAL